MTRPRISHLFLLLSLLTFSIATVPSFCKCTCFTQSGIIPLNPPSTKPTSEIPTDTDSPPTTNSQSRQTLLNRLSNILPRSATRAPVGTSTSASCTKCNRAFCLAQSLPFCTDATESDVFTACFQRDSEKDMFIVWGFILATVGLLGWAGVRRGLKRRRERLAGGDGEGGGEYQRVGGRG